ncbi:DUF4031 domain-containing protein [Leucobacter sp. GX24907]
MAILIDQPRWPAHGTLWSHLVSDTDYEELHDFAKRMRIPRRSFDLDHYDLPASLYEQAVSLGAEQVGQRDMVHRLRDAGLRVRQVEREVATPLRRRQFLTMEWAGLGELIGIGGSARAGDEWRILGDDLISRWNEPHRAYHDELHLEDVLLALDHLATRGERLEPATLLAAWFHDAVYTGSTGSDELDSASLATSALAPFEVDAGLVQLVGEIIVATNPGRAVEDASPPLAHMLDADLAIFASPQHRYAQYASAVRVEYAHVPPSDFAVGRSRILSGYLGQPTIYRTETARQLWEERARANLEREISELREI